MPTTTTRSSTTPPTRSPYRYIGRYRHPNHSKITDIIKTSGRYDTSLQQVTPTLTLLTLILNANFTTFAQPMRHASKKGTAMRCDQAIKGRTRKVCGRNFREWASVRSRDNLLFTAFVCMWDSDCMVCSTRSSSLSYPLDLFPHSFIHRGTRLILPAIDRLLVHLATAFPE